MFAPLPDETLTENIPPTKWRKTGAAARLTWEVGRAILVSSNSGQAVFPKIWKAAFLLPKL